MSGSQFLEVMTNTIFDMEDEKNKKRRRGASRRSNIVGECYSVIHCKRMKGVWVYAIMPWDNLFISLVTCYSFYFPLKDSQLPWPSNGSVT